MADRAVTPTYPICGTATAEAMHVDRCVFFFDCPSCHTILKPQPGDCCVYCSYCNKRRPPVQDERPCPSYDEVSSRPVPLIFDNPDDRTQPLFDRLQVAAAGNTANGHVQISGMNNLY